MNKFETLYCDENDNQLIDYACFYGSSNFYVVYLDGKKLEITRDYNKALLFYRLLRDHYLEYITKTEEPINDDIVEDNTVMLN